MTQQAEKQEAIDGTPSGEMAQAHAAAEGKGNQKGESKATGPSFDPNFMQKVVKAQEQLDSIKQQRAELNAKANAVIASLEKEGLNKHAVRAAIKYHSMDPKQREAYDLSYAVARKALGQPLQDDLFVAAAKREVEQHQAGKQH